MTLTESLTHQGTWWDMGSLPGSGSCSEQVDQHYWKKVFQMYICLMNYYDRHLELGFLLNLSRIPINTRFRSRGREGKPISEGKSGILG